MKKTQFDIHLDDEHLDLKKRPEKRDEPVKDNQIWTHIGFFSGIGFVIVTPLVVLTGAGILFDQRFSTDPYGKYTGIILGFVFSITGFVKTMTDFIASNRKPKTP